MNPNWSSIEKKPIGKKFSTIYDSSKKIKWAKINDYFRPLRLTRLENFKRWIKTNQFYVELDDKSSNRDDHLLYIKTRTNEYFILDFYNSYSTRTIDNSIVRLINCVNYDDCNNELITREDFYYFRETQEPDELKEELEDDLFEGFEEMKLTSRPKTIVIQSKPETIAIQSIVIQSIPKIDSQITLPYPPQENKADYITQSIIKAVEKEFNQVHDILEKASIPQISSISIPQISSIPKRSISPKRADSPQFGKDLEQKTEFKFDEAEMKELATEEKMSVSELIKQSITALAPKKMKAPPEMISTLNEPTRKFKKAVEKEANLLLYNGELILNESGSSYVTNMQFQIDIIKYDKTKFPQKLAVLHEFSKLDLAPSYILSIRSSIYYLKTKIYTMNLLKWLQQGAQPHLVKKKLEEVSNAIDKFRKHNLNHLNLSLTNIILKEDDTIAFTNFGENACTVAISQTLEYSHLANNVYILTETKKITLKNKDIVYNWLHEKLGQNNGMENMRFQHYINDHRAEDEHLLKSCKIPTEEKIDKLKVIETTKFYRNFIEANYGENALTNLTTIPINTITCISHMKRKVNKAWIFILNKMYILKLTRCNGEYMGSAKYEILMHLKFMEAEKTLKRRMAPKLLAYDMWKLAFSKDVCVGWISEKIHTLTDSMAIREDIKEETVANWFGQIESYYEYMCKAGLWHFDSHVGNWGFVEKKIVLFDFEFASIGHDVINCDWTHEIATFAHGLNLVWEDYERLNPKNVKLVTMYFHQLHTNLYNKQQKSVMKPLPFDINNPRTCLQILGKDDHWFFNKRIDNEKKMLYVIAHFNDFAPFKLK